MIQIPQVDKKFTIKNTGTALGNIVGSFNLDLYTNVGKIRVSPRGMLNTDIAGGSAVPVAFRFLQGKWWAAAGSKVYKTGSTSLNPAEFFTADALTGSPTNLLSSLSDMEIFSSTSSGSMVQYLYATTNSTSVYKTNGSGAWTNFVAGATSGEPRMLCSFNNRMYMTYGFNKIISWDITDTVATIGSPNTITVGDFLTNITWMKATQNRIFIGTQGVLPGRTNIYVWDGVQSSNFDSIIKVAAIATISCTVMNDIPYVMDSNGYLLKYNGAYFIEVARLPLPAGRLLLGADSTNNNVKGIHPNGMTVVRGKINILVCSTMPVLQEYCPSGIWEYDEEIGLYHKASASYTSCQISNSNTILDYGQWNVASVGALVDANTNDTSSSPLRNGNLLYGVSYYTNASSVNDAIFTNDFVQLCDKVGYFITPEMYSENIESLWSNIFLRYRKFMGGATYTTGITERIDAYYRTVTDTPVDYTGTMVNSGIHNTFTIASDITALYAVGDHVEFLQGYQAGISTYITSISFGGGVTTVVVASAINNSSITTQTIKVRLSKWQYIGSTTNTGSLANAKNQFIKLGLPINANDTRIQLKIVMFFQSNDELEQLVLIETPQVTAT